MRIRLRQYVATTLVVAVSGFALTTLQAQNANTATSGRNATENKGSRKADHFLKEAVEQNQLEMSAAQLGASKAQNQQLKSLSQQLQQDHSALEQKLTALAQTHNVKLEQTKDRREQRELQDLQKANGAQFDKDLAMFFLKSHQEAIDQYARASRSIQEPDVQQLAANALPELRQHFEHAQQVAQAVGVSQSTISSIVKKEQKGMGGSQNMESGSSNGQNSSGNIESGGSNGQNSNGSQSQSTTK